jgi:hypothetical protein
VAKESTSQERTGAARAALRLNGPWRRFGLPTLKVCDKLATLAHPAILDDGVGPGHADGPVQNKAQFKKVKGRLESGTVWINKHPDLDPRIPFGGVKQSGLGVELGEEGFREFTQIQVVSLFD